jgi:chorismate mutase / prephenate dehydratase
MNNEMDKIRSSIDSIDNDITRLLSKRAGLSKQVGRLKHENGMKTYSPEREREIIDRLEGFIEPPLERSMIEAVFNTIFSVSRSLQAVTKVAYLGPVGTYSHEAAISVFPCDADLIPEASIDSIIDDVNAGRVELGVVPVENSTEGMINQTLDLMVSSRLFVIKEILLPVRHCLLSKTDIGNISKVYSHPQPFAQCRLWLKKNLPDAKTIDTASTSEASQIALSEENSAAIASSNAARIYGLDILAKNINDYHDNITRFWIISKKMAKPGAVAKTSIIMALDNTPGALYHALGVFSSQAINLTKIQSRPSRKGPWEYLFFIDFIGGLLEEKVAKALENLKPYTKEIIILGSYPEEQGAD